MHRANLVIAPRVTTVDIRDTYTNYIRVLCRYVTEHKVIDIFAMEQTYDIVMASHVIEHVPGPLAFCQRLQALSTGTVFVCAPYMEKRDKITRGHMNVFDDKFIESSPRPTLWSLWRALPGGCSSNRATRC